jgi:hypothetical protein
MWKVLRDRAQGTSHRQSNTPCQDSELSSHFQSGENQILFLCCSDGAGSATQSDKGSEAACINLWHSVEQALCSGICLSDITKEHVVHWYCDAARNLVEEARKLDVQPRELACTLIGAVVDRDVAIFFQLGDGGIVINLEQEYRPIFWPQSGEYVNETNFLTDANLVSNILFSTHCKRVDEIALFTDGLQPLVLDYPRKSAHAPFFNQMFQTLRLTEMNDLHVPFKDFLNSAQVNERTDDDKTLILAARVDDNDTSIL